MSDIKTLCIYCGASSNVDDVYKDAAREVGTYCAAQGYTIVYGGGSSGLMGIVADSALAAGGQVIGVIPEDLLKREVAYEGLTERHVTQSMHERQMKMVQLSDAFLALPGGLGTLAEFFEVLTWRSLNFHQKPVVMYNVDGYWDLLLKTIENSREKGFLHAEDKGLVKVIHDTKGLDNVLSAQENISESALTEKM